MRVQWPTLADLLRERDIKLLVALGFDFGADRASAFMEAIIEDPTRLHPGAAEDALRALERIDALHPDQIRTARLCARRLRPASTGLEQLQGWSAPPPDQREPGWRPFDVSRVLADL